MPADSAKHLCAAVLATICVIGLAACGEVVSTSSFKGEEGVVAQRISQFQSDATKSENETICHNDLAAALKKRIETSGGSCKQAIKDQLAEIDTFTLSISSIDISGDTASALVKSNYAGKIKPSKLTLVREDRTWKISGVGSA
jgi:Putative lumazine-binding